MINYAKRDWLIAGLVSLIVLIIGAFSLTTGTPWGDDQAAYISEGIAIAEGRLQEQSSVNYQYHPSDLPDEAGEGRLVYVWGYPLILSAVYRIVGFDQVDFTSVLWYKIPLLLCFSLSGGVLTLFLRRRFSIYTAAGASLVFCMSGDLIDAVNTLYSDIPFLFFCLLTLWLMECFSDAAVTGKRSAWIGLIYAVSLWMTYETRLSGWTVCLAALVGHTILMCREKSKIGKGSVLIQLFPYLLLGILIMISEHLWLEPATQNLSDINKNADSNQILF